MPKKDINTKTNHVIPIPFFVDDDVAIFVDPFLSKDERKEVDKWWKKGYITGKIYSLLAGSLFLMAFGWFVFFLCFAEKFHISVGVGYTVALVIGLCFCRSVMIAVWSGRKFSTDKVPASFERKISLYRTGLYGKPFFLENIPAPTEELLEVLKAIGYESSKLGTGTNAGNTEHLQVLLKNNEGFILSNEQVEKVKELISMWVKFYYAKRQKDKFLHIVESNNSTTHIDESLNTRLEEYKAFYREVVADIQDSYNNHLLIQMES